jgi:hypothetical protein
LVLEGRWQQVHPKLSEQTAAIQVVLDCLAKGPEEDLVHALQEMTQVHLEAESVVKVVRRPLQAHRWCTARVVAAPSRRCAPLASQVPVGLVLAEDQTMGQIQELVVAELAVPPVRKVLTES